LRLRAPIAGWLALRAAVTLALCSAAAAQDGLGPPSATLRIESTSVAAGIGVSWGRGTLHFRDSEFRFSVSGLSVADVGVARVTATGEVFGLAELAKFPGTYQGVDVGVAVGGGTSGIALRNEHGVQLRLRAVQQGIRFSLASKGMTVTLEH
jgi:hypothetical protein